MKNFFGDVIWQIFYSGDKFEYLALSSQREWEFTCNTQNTVEWTSFEGSCG